MYKNVQIGIQIFFPSSPTMQISSGQISCFIIITLSLLSSPHKRAHGTNDLALINTIFPKTNYQILFLCNYTDLIFADLFSLTLFWIHFQIFALVKSRTSLAILEVADLSFWSLPRAVSAFLQGPPQSFSCLLPKIISATQHTTTQQQHNNTTSCKAHHNHSVVFCQNHQCNTTCIYMKYKYEYE